MRQEVLRDKRHLRSSGHHCFGKFTVVRLRFMAIREGILLGKGIVHFFVEPLCLGNNLSAV